MTQDKPQAFGVQGAIDLTSVLKVIRDPNMLQVLSQPILVDARNARRNLRGAEIHQLAGETEMLAKKESALGELRLS
jgi:hypothetical protein